MRVWDIPVSNLCNKHLIAQHHEIHCIYSILTNNLKGFRHHPEVLRWEGHLGILAKVHADTVFEMQHRNFNHTDGTLFAVTDSFDYPKSWQSVEQQKEILRSKNCGCKV